MHDFDVLGYVTFIDGDPNIQCNDCFNGDPNGFNVYPIFAPHVYTCEDCGEKIGSFITCEEEISIRILDSNDGGFLYYIDGELTHDSFEETCQYCHRPLDKNYIIIMKGLKNAGLVNEQDPLLCCSCFKKG